jgi:hypothetical protein
MIDFNEIDIWLDDVLANESAENMNNFLNNQRKKDYKNTFEESYIPNYVDSYFQIEIGESNLVEVEKNESNIIDFENILICNWNIKNNNRIEFNYSSILGNFLFDSIEVKNKKNIFTYLNNENQYANAA